MKNIICRFYLLPVLVFLVYISAIVGCRRTPPATGDFCGLEYEPDELVVWRKPGVSNNKWDSTKFSILGPLATNGKPMFKM